MYKKIITFFYCVTDGLNNIPIIVISLLNNNNILINNKNKPITNKQKIKIAKLKTILNAVSIKNNLIY